MTLSPATIALVACVLVSAALATWSQVKERRRLHLVTKPLATALIIAVAALAAVPVPPAYKTLVLAGLVFSLLGDVALMFPDKWFTAGLAAFLAAQVLYILAFKPRPGHPVSAGDAPPLHPLRPADVLPAGPQARPAEVPGLRLHRRHHDDGRVRGGALRRHGRDEGAPGLHRRGPVPRLRLRAGLRPLRPESALRPDPRPRDLFPGPAPDRPVRLNRTQRGQRGGNDAAVDPDDHLLHFDRRRPRAPRPCGRCARARNSRARS
ncbi:MAG: lysoplasmalogenase [Comamonadaceae bacterium]|nr:lysoplasmalogenase [Comamonadaceae bacterium]